MLINVSQPEECRIAIVEDGVLEELYVERAGQDNYVGNIYKGVVVNLEPSIQAAFVDFGVGRNGFLHISDIEPQYFRQGGYDPDQGRRAAPAAAPRRRSARSESAVGDEFDEGDEDDGRSGRATTASAAGRASSRPSRKSSAAATKCSCRSSRKASAPRGRRSRPTSAFPAATWCSCPRWDAIGVSRKIEDEDVRRRLRDIMLELNPPKGVGFIVRTAGSDRTKRELSRDMAYLLRLWKVIARRIKKLPGPVDIYEESDMIIRTIRDIFTADVDAIYIDEPTAYERAKEFLQLVMPRYVNRLQLYEGKEPLFCKYNLDEEIAKIHRRRVPLKSGGSIVIDQTEALVAIDVNSGSFRAEDSAEETAYQMNMLAAKEIARQIRLRDLGGVIVNDFIDMRKEKHRRGVERALRDAMKRDRARTKILRTSPFGLIEMTRQRIRTKPQAERVYRLPELRRHGCGQDARKHGDRRGPPADPGQPAAAGHARGRSRWPKTWPIT